MDDGATLEVPGDESGDSGFGGVDARGESPSLSVDWTEWCESSPSDAVSLSSLLAAAAEASRVLYLCDARPRDRGRSFFQGLRDLGPAIPAPAGASRRSLGRGGQTWTSV